MCQRGAECQAPAQLVCQQWDFSEELERITKSQQEWLPGGEKAGAGQRSRLEQSKRENSEARTLVTQGNNRTWKHLPTATLTFLYLKKIRNSAYCESRESMQGQVYLSVIMVNCTFFCASASILIERNVIVELFIFPRCYCHIEVKKGIRNLGEKRNQLTGNKFNYCTSLQRVFLQVSLQHWSLKAYQEFKNLGVKVTSIIVPFLKEFFFKCPY